MHSSPISAPGGDDLGNLLCPLGAIPQRLGWVQSETQNHMNHISHNSARLQPGEWDLLLGLLELNPSSRR